ncbi:hypothetical protein CVT91_04780 [Candidatus Atribacteria bacterium HGW-Atribacteria-1]|nr:MAG: hypothetical protein CVT91_04780 [Candidatus Atribacteria bacterium HGW-Atribacteria-1]
MRKNVVFSAVVLIPKNTELDLRRETHLLAKGTCIINGGTVMIVKEPLSLIRIIRSISLCKLEPVSCIMILKQATEQ